MRVPAGIREDSSVPAGSSRAAGRTVIYVVYLLAALDVTWMFLQFTVTPYLARKLGLDTLWLGYLQTSVGLIQLLGGPLFGRFGDVYGARAALTLACSSTTVFFVLLTFANHPAMLFIHKLPTVFMHVMPVTQMVVADLSPAEQRADSLSKLGLCFGVGMIAGSTLGGQLNKHYGERWTAGVGAAGSAFSLLLVLIFIPTTTKSENPPSISSNKNSNKSSIFSLREITRLMEFPRVTRTFTVKIVAGLPSVIFQVMFSIVALEVFQLQPEQNGFLLAYFGIVQMVIQGGVIGRLTGKYSDYSLLLLSVGVSCLVGVAQALMQNVIQFCVIAVPMMFSLSLFNVITDSMLTSSVPASDTGTMLGLCASVQSLLRTVGPTLGGFLYVNYGVASIGLVQFSINSLVFLYLLLRRLRTPKQKKE